MMSFSSVDLLFLVIVAAFAIVGFLSGFITEVFGKAAPVVSAVVAFLGFRLLVEPVEMHVKIHVLAVVLSFLLLFVIVFIIMKIIQLIVEKIFDGEIFKDLNRFLGCIFGIIEGLLVVCILMFVICAQPWFDSSFMEGSFFARVLYPLIKGPIGLLSDNVNARFGR